MRHLPARQTEKETFQAGEWHRKRHRGLRQTWFLESGILKSKYAAFSIEFLAFAEIMTNFMCREERHKQVLKRSFFHWCPGVIFYS